MAPADTIAGSGSDDLSGRLLAGRYRLNRTIAAGGMAMVWEGTDQLLDRRVAIKILHPHLAQDASFVRRFRGEAVAAARLAHPSIVSIYDTVSDGGLDAIVMELVSGTTLRADLDEHGPLKLHAVLAIGTQVADALGAAHAADLVHRDVKPANILLSADGRVLVADFGIAKAAQGSDLTEAGAMVGTAKYLAPEQVEGGPVDGRTDLYALGIVLYEALTGRPPFVADTDASTAFARLHRDPEPPRRLRPDIPYAVEQVVLRALARRPEDRFPDAAAFRRALVAAGADPSRAPAAAQAAALAASGEHAAVSAAPPAAPPRPAPAPAPAPSPAPPSHVLAAPEHGHEEAPRRRRTPWIILSVLVIGALVAAFVAFGGGLSSGNDDEGARLPIRRVGSFDPAGDGEMDNLLSHLADGDPTTVWRTEKYGSREFRVPTTPDKTGVGFYVGIAEPAAISSIELQTPVGGWSAQVYVLADLGANDRPPADLAGWGDPVTEVTDVPTGTVNVTLPSTTGQAVLVWFTKAVPFADKNAVQISDVSLRGT